MTPEERKKYLDYMEAEIFENTREFPRLKRKIAL